MSSKLDVAILMGSDSDLVKMTEAKKACEELGLKAEMRVLSAHRTPEALVKFLREAEERGVRVFIAGAGLAAHLAGAIAAQTTQVVIGVPLSGGPLQGHDALLSTVQMPRGIPVATVAIDGAWNAGVLAAQIVGRDAELKKYRKGLAEKVLEKSIPKV